MEKLSIEEKAKAYDKAREKIVVRFGTNVAEEIFSEFEEPEDERIRKELIRSFTNQHSSNFPTTDAFIEKIENYLNSQLYDWVSITNPDQRSHPNVIPKKDFIEDFVNFIKRE